MARAKQPSRGTTKDEVKIEDEAASTTETEAAEAGASTEDTELVAQADVSTPADAEAEPAEIRADAAAEPKVPELVESRAAEPTDGGAAPVRATALAIMPSVDSAQVSLLGSIVTEMTDYSKRSVENAVAFVRKLVEAKSYETVVTIQSEYAKTSYVDFIVYMTKIGEIYSNLAKDVFERRSRVA